MNTPAREASIARRTAETEIDCRLALDGGPSKLATGIPFLDHMLDQVARHGRMGIELACAGDLAVDLHHTVEDCGLALGEAVAEALGSKAGIVRFAAAHAPLDEALARTVIDLSGRPGLFFRASFSRPAVGSFDLQLVREFFQGFANAAAATVHIDLLEGSNAHHQAEAIFKSFALALGAAAAVRDPDGTVPSTKGRL